MAAKLIKSQEEEEEEILREENKRRTEEALKKVSAQREKSSERGGEDERRKRALESIHRMEWLKNQDDVAASLRSGTGKGAKVRGRKKETEETIKSLQDFSTTAELPPPPPRNCPPAPPAISAWSVKPGAALFRGTSAALRITYGIKNYDEELMLGQALQESLMEQELYGVGYSLDQSSQGRRNYQTSTRESSLRPPQKDARERSPGIFSNGTTASGDEDDKTDYYQKGKELAEKRARERQEARRAAEKEREAARLAAEKERAAAEIELQEALRISAKEFEEQKKAAVPPKLDPEVQSLKPRSSLKSPRSSADSPCKNPIETSTTKAQVKFAVETELPPVKPIEVTAPQPPPAEDQRKIWSSKDTEDPIQETELPKFTEVASTPKYTEVASPTYTEEANTPKYTEVASPTYTEEANTPDYTEVASTPIYTEVASTTKETDVMEATDAGVRTDSKKVEVDANRVYTPEELICFEVKTDVPANPVDSLESNPAASPYQYNPYDYNCGAYPGMNTTIPDPNALQYNYLSPSADPYYPSGNLSLAEQAAGTDPNGPLLQAFQGLRLEGMANLDPNILGLTIFLNRYVNSQLGGVPLEMMLAGMAQLPKVPVNSVNDVARPATPPPPPLPRFPQPYSESSTPLSPSHVYNPSMGYPGFAPFTTQSSFIRAPAGRGRAA